MTNDSANWNTSNTNFSSLTPFGLSGLQHNMDVTTSILVTATLTTRPLYKTIHAGLAGVLRNIFQVKKYFPHLHCSPDAGSVYGIFFFAM